MHKVTAWTKNYLIEFFRLRESGWHIVGRLLVLAVRGLYGTLGLGKLLATYLSATGEAHLCDLYPDSYSCGGFPPSETMAFASGLGLVFFGFFYRKYLVVRLLTAVAVAPLAVYLVKAAEAEVFGIPASSPDWDEVWPLPAVVGTILFSYALLLAPNKYLPRFMH